MEVPSDDVQLNGSPINESREQKGQENGRDEGGEEEARGIERRESGEKEEKGEKQEKEEQEGKEGKGEREVEVGQVVSYKYDPSTRARPVVYRVRHDRPWVDFLLHSSDSLPSPPSLLSFEPGRLNGMTSYVIYINHLIIYCLVTDASRKTIDRENALGAAVRNILLLFIVYSCFN